MNDRLPDLSSEKVKVIRTEFNNTGIFLWTRHHTRDIFLASLLFDQFVVLNPGRFRFIFFEPHG